jgi:hypothetical protein
MPRADATEQLTKVEEWALDAIKANQDRVVQLNGKLASLVERLPKVKVPFADRLPDQKAVVSRYYDFVAKSAEANRDFAQAMVDVWSAGGTKPLAATSTAAAPTRAASKPRAATKSRTATKSRAATKATKAT